MEGSVELTDCNGNRFSLFICFICSTLFFVEYDDESTSASFKIERSSIANSFKATLGGGTFTR